MHPDLLDYYNRELAHLRELGGEFARTHPKIAGRLGLDSFECADPYVERLLEGFAFLTARIQLKQDAAFPQFCQQLLQRLHPNYLAPTPSMAVVQFQPDLNHPRLADGVPVPRHTVLNGRLGAADTRCRYRTAHALTLWPLALTGARYQRYSKLATGIDAPAGTRALLRLEFAVSGGLSASQLALDTLPLYLRGSDALPFQLYEHLLAHQCGALLVGGSTPRPLPRLVPQGVADNQALLPEAAGTLPGFRLLQEYFALPQRHLFVEQQGLGAALAGCDGNRFELVWCLDRHEPLLEQTLDASHFALFATPAINLFPLRGARIALSDERIEHLIVPDPVRPLDYEVYQVDAVRGYDEQGVERQRFESFYRAWNQQPADGTRGYYQLRRALRLPSVRQQRDGGRGHYPGSDAWLALTDADQAPYRPDLRQIGVDLLCTNRDLPLSLPVGGGSTDFTLESELPLAAVRCLSGPTPPQPMRADGKLAWRLLQRLTHNYLSLAASRPEDALTALQSLLALYCPDNDPAARRQLEGLTGLSTRAVTRRLPQPGPLAFGRGLEVTLQFDDTAFGGGSAFLLATVLHRFFATQASLNSLVETVAVSRTRGEILRSRATEGSWPTL